VVKHFRLIVNDRRSWIWKERGTTSSSDFPEGRRKTTVSSKYPFLDRPIYNVRVLKRHLAYRPYTHTMDIKNTVTHMTIVRQRLGKHIPEFTLSTIEGRSLLGNRLLDTFPQQRINTRFYGGGFLETKSVQNAFPCKRRFNKGFRVSEQARKFSMDTAGIYKRPCR
jgi:hypothetical protein